MQETDSGNEAEEPKQCELGWSSVDRGQSGGGSTRTTGLEGGGQTVNENTLDKQLQLHLKMARTLLDAMGQALRESNPEDVWRYSTYWGFADRYVALCRAVADSNLFDGQIRSYDMEAMPRPGDAIAAQQQTMFENTRADLRILIATLEGQLGSHESEASEIAMFLSGTLRRAIFDLPTKEREVQDALESLLVGRGMRKGLDYDREVGRVKVSAKEVVPDFIVPRIGLAIEVKLLKERNRLGSVIDEINADIQAYLMEYKALLVIIYDTGNIRDEDEFRRDLEATEAVKVEIVKH